MANGNFGGGDGSISSPYLIEDVLDLLEINRNRAGVYRMIKNIDASSFVGPAIVESDFTGIFDGGGFSISNLTLESENHALGLFSNTLNATIQNVHLKNYQSRNPAQSGAHCGSLIGFSRDTKILNCSATGVVRNDGSSSTGGLIGNLTGSSIERTSIVNSYSHCEVHGKSDTGGLLGSIHGIGRIVDCYSTGDVYATGPADDAGGFLGDAGPSQVESRVERCYSTGNVHGGNYLGGFVGYVNNAASAWTFKNCYALCSYVKRNPNSTQEVIGAFCGNSAPIDPSNHILNTMSFIRG